MRQLDEKYPHLGAGETAPAPTSTIAAPVAHLDLATVLKVSQAVSGEIVLEKLIDTLLRTAIEQAGAERGLLILSRGDELSIAAEANTSGDTVTVRVREGPVTASEFPESVVHYAARTQESVLLDDASAPSPFSTDEYIRRAHARSVLCLPLVKQGRLVALLYLENRLASSVFTPSSIALLNVLASQAAISLENSGLYRKLQQREAEIRRLFDANIVGIVFWEVDGGIRDANDAFLRMVGYERADLVAGRLRWTDLTPREWLKRDREYAEQQVRLTGRVQPYEKEFLRKDGSRVPVFIGGAAFDAEIKHGVAFVVDITERKRAEEELRRSQHYLAETQKVSHTGSWAWSPVSNTLLYWSEECYRILGYDPVNGLPSFESSFERIHPEDRPALTETIARAVQEKAEFQVEYRLVLPDGTRRNVRILSQPVLDASGKLVEFIGTVMDITEQKRAEEERREHLWFLACMDRVNRAMQRTNDLEAMTSGVLDETLAIFGCDRAWLVYPCDPHAAACRAVMEHTRPEYPGAFVLGERFPVSTQAAETMRRLLDTPGALTDPSISPELRERFNIQSSIAIAVRPRGDRAYLLGLHQCTHARTWTAAERRLFEEIAHRLEDALTGVLAHRNLLASEERYARAMEGSDVGHWDWSIVTDEMFLSERARQMLVLPDGALPRTRMAIMALVPQHPDDLAGWNKNVAEGIAAGRYEREYRVIPKPGEVRWIRACAKVFKDGHGVAIRMVGSLADITESKLAEGALRASEERYSLALDATEEGHFDVNIDKDEVLTSAPLNEIYGFPPGTRLVKRSECLKGFPFYGNDAEIYHAEIRAAEAKGGPERYEFEYRILRSSGEVRWLRTRGKVTRDAEGRARRRTGVVADITERKRAEDALRASEQRYSLAMDAAEEGHFDLNIDTGELFISERLNGVYGFAPGTRFANRREYLDTVRLYPEDADKYHAEMAAAVADGGPERYEFGFRIVRPSGELRWLWTRGKVTRDAEGRAHRRTGVIADITARKLAEEAHRNHLWFLESMDRINRAMQRSNELELMMSGVLEETMAIFGSDRARLVYPCDPDAAISRVVMEHSRPEYPGAFAIGEEVPMDRHAAEFVRRVLDSPGAATVLSNPPEMRERFRVQSAIAIAVRPKGDRPYLFGLHQCSHARIWTAAERRLFEEIARRLEDTLTSVLAHRNLLASEERFALALETSEEGHFDADLETGEIFVSARMNEINGFARQPTIADRIEYFNQIPFHPDDRHVLADILRRESEHGTYDDYEFECRIVSRPGEVRWVHARGKVMRDAEGRARRRIGIIADITARKIAEEALLDARERLAQASKIASLAELSASIAHEINQPLQAIVANGHASLRWLDATPPNIEKAIRTAKRVVRDGNAAAEVVSRIRALFKHAAPAKVDLDINELILQVRTLMADDLHGNAVSLETQLGEDLPRIRADAVQIQQVIVNLARNAIEAMAEAPRKPLLIRSRRSASHVVVDVRDAGTGLVDPGKIFEPFVSTKPTGMGMGLPICRSITEAHGGGIWVVRNEGPGVTFSFSLPIEATKAT